MERRIGSVLIYVGNREAAPQVNEKSCRCYCNLL